jgi:hypothetical protein
MLRGQRNFTSLFPIETPNVLEIPERKGRSELLLLKRNELLVSRHYYYGKIYRYHYDDLMKVLSDELFLTIRTIQDILQKNNDLLRHVYSSNPDVQVFRDKFPQYVW